MSESPSYITEIGNEIHIKLYVIKVILKILLQHHIHPRILPPLEVRLEQNTMYDIEDGASFEVETVDYMYTFGWAMDESLESKEVDLQVLNDDIHTFVNELPREVEKSDCIPKISSENPIFSTDNVSEISVGKWTLYIGYFSIKNKEELSLEDSIATVDINVPNLICTEIEPIDSKGILQWTLDEEQLYNDAYNDAFNDEVVPGKELFIKEPCLSDDDKAAEMQDSLLSMSSVATEKIQQNMKRGSFAFFNSIKEEIDYSMNNYLHQLSNTSISFSKMSSDNLYDLLNSYLMED